MDLKRASKGKSKLKQTVRRQISHKSLPVSTFAVLPVFVFLVGGVGDDGNN